MEEERTFSCICHRIADPPCWWCWNLDTFDNPWLDEDPEPELYEEYEIQMERETR